MSLFGLRTYLVLERPCKLDADALTGDMVYIERETGESGYNATNYHTVILTRFQLLRCLVLLNNRRKETS